jgi:hypothetical protein
MWLFTSVAFGAAPGHWHPSDLAPLSALYAESSAKLRSVLADRESSGQAFADAILEYEEALDLLGPDAPAAEREHLAELESDFKSLRLEVQLFAETLVGDYDSAFRRAVARAAGPSFYELQECQAHIEVEGTSMPGLPADTIDNPACEGPNLNATLAAKADADPELKADLDEIVARPWPQIAATVAPRPVLGGEPRWVSVRAVVAGVAGESLEGIASSDALARMELSSEVLEAGDDPEALADLRTKADAIDQNTATSRATVGAPILAAARTVLTKRSDDPPIGWCPYPSRLGGCLGAEAPDVATALVNHKKVRKAAPKS